MVDTGLRGKVALVTGANNPDGIGAAVARRLADEGAFVFITSFGQPSPDEVVQSLRARGAQVEVMEVDLSDPAIVPVLFDRVEAAFGPVDILINNAAVGGAPKDTFVPVHAGDKDWAGRNAEMVSAANHDRHFAVNSRGTALMTAEFTRRRVGRGLTGGRVINVSTDGAPAFAEEVSYGASKAALESYSRAAARELGRYGITVNIISPGPTQTGWIPPEVEDEIVRTIPLGRLGRADDIADVMLFLASEQARWLTGQTLFVGGGHRMW